MVTAEAANHEQARDGDAAQHKRRIGCKRGLEPADRIACQPEIIGDRMVESLRRRRRSGESQPLLVFGHLIVLSESIRPCAQAMSSSWNEPGARGARPADHFCGTPQGQIPPSRTKSRPSRTKKMGLDCLGFLRPIRGFSTGYRQSKLKITPVVESRRPASFEPIA